MTSGIFLIIFGLFFGGVPLIILISSILTEPEFLSEDLFLLIFVAVGLLVFLIGIKQFYRYLRLKKIEKNGKEATGYFISYHSNTTINNTPVFYVKFYYTNERNERVEIKSPSKYYYDEVEYFRLLQNFKIKYDETDATIVEKFNLEQYKKLLQSKTNPIENLDEDIENTKDLTNSNIIENLTNNENNNNLIEEKESKIDYLQEKYLEENNLDNETTKQNNYNKQTYDNYSSDNYPPIETYYECKYCGNPQKTTGKCTNCGAKITKSDKRQ